MSFELPARLPKSAASPGFLPGSPGRPDPGGGTPGSSGPRGLWSGTDRGSEPGSIPRLARFPLPRPSTIARPTPSGRPRFWKWPTPRRSKPDRLWSGRATSCSESSGKRTQQRHCGCGPARVRSHPWSSARRFGLIVSHEKTARAAGGYRVRKADRLRRPRSVLRHGNARAPPGHGGDLRLRDGGLGLTLRNRGRARGVAEQRQRGRCRGDRRIHAGGDVPDGRKHRRRRIHGGADEWPERRPRFSGEGARRRLGTCMSTAPAKSASGA